DFINTSYGVDHAHRDCLVDDAAVLHWLGQAGVQPADAVAAPDGLLRLALQLRDSALSLLDVARSGGQPDVDVVNRLLQDGHAPLQLAWNADTRGFETLTLRRTRDAASLLEPVALALVRLL